MNRDLDYEVNIGPEEALILAKFDSVVKKVYPDAVISFNTTKWYTAIHVNIGNKKHKILNIYRNGVGAHPWAFSISGYYGPETSEAKNSIQYVSPDQITSYSKVIINVINKAESGIKLKRVK